MVWLLDGEKKYNDMFSHFDVQYRRVTDRQTDRQTDEQPSGDSIVRAMHSIAM